MDYSKQSVDNQLSGGENSFNPNRQIYTMPANIRTEDVQDFEYIDPTKNGGVPGQDYWLPGTTTGSNPYWTIHRNIRENGRERLMALTSLTYDFSSALKLMLRASYDGSNNNNSEKSYFGTYRTPTGQYSVGLGNSQLITSDFLLSYKRDINKDWNFNINLGGDIQKRESESESSSTGSQMVVPNFFTISNTLLPTTSYNPGSPTETQSLYSFGSISWKNGIFLDITARNDWSSTLPSESRSYFYPSVGMSAVLSDLIPGLPKVISFAKIRGSFAQVGSSAPFGRIQRTAQFRAGGNNGFITLSSSLPNTELRPEKTNATEVGLDIRFFDSRLGFNISAYQTQTKDQLFSVALPVASGAAEYFTNGGNVENKGIEALITSTPVRGALTWDLDFNFALNRNKVISISDERPRVVVGSDQYFREYIAEQGQPFGQIYGRGWLRDAQGRVTTGADGMPKFTAARTVLIGNFNPDWTGSISNSLSYKNFGLSFLIDHRQGGTMASNTNANTYGQGVDIATLNGREGGLIFGKNIFSNETAVMADGSPNTVAVTAQKFWQGVGGRNAPVGEAFIEDATSTRFRELSIGYTFPKSIVSRLRVSGVKASLVGRNLFYISRKAKDLDTDFLESTDVEGEGFQSFAPPTTRTFGINLKIDF